MALITVRARMLQAQGMMIAQRTYNMPIHSSTMMNRVLDQISEVQSHAQYLLHVFTHHAHFGHVSTISCTAGALSCDIQQHSCFFAQKFRSA
eukprot:9927748-Karenia_brevis.AAC.1